MPLTRYYILESDTTTAGGIIQTTTNPIVFDVDGKKQSCIGDNVWCPACGSMGQIIPSGPRLSFSLGGAMPAPHAIIHELGHSYGLYHTFIQNELSVNSPHTFFRGYTDNIMDYQSFQLPQDVIDKWRANPTTNELNNKNTKKDTMFALFKWQWDIIQNDKSIQRGQSHV